MISRSGDWHGSATPKGGLRNASSGCAVRRLLLIGRNRQENNATKALRAAFHGRVQTGQQTQQSVLEPCKQVPQAAHPAPAPLWLLPHIPCQRSLLPPSLLCAYFASVKTTSAPTSPLLPLYHLTVLFPLFIQLLALGLLVRLLHHLAPTTATFSFYS